ncbi:MAG: hypothetical protein KTR17_06210 [Cellvibrionaceae bacterium]|nr:hypothetical protein [Cellvibrionaceae bacterium]
MSITQKKPLKSVEDKLMCRYGFYRWILKGEQPLCDTAKKSVLVQRCVVCGKETFAQ